MSDLSNPVNWFNHRRKIRMGRRGLKRDGRQWLDRHVAEIYSESKDVPEFRQFVTAKANADSVEMGFDPATIMLLIQLAVLIYQLLKHFEVISPSLTLVTALVDEDY